MTRTTHTAFPAGCEAHRGALLHFLDDPGNEPDPRDGTLDYFGETYPFPHEARFSDGD